MYEEANVKDVLVLIESNLSKSIHRRQCELQMKESLQYILIKKILLAKLNNKL